MACNCTIKILATTVIVGAALTATYLYKDKILPPSLVTADQGVTNSSTDQSVPVQPPKIFDAQTFELDNGMRVVLVENHKIPVVTHMVWYKVGASDEPHGKSGIAHFFEHLMFKGTQAIAPGDFSKTVRNLGGNDNAFTSQDYTAYFQSVPSQHLGKMMEMEADRMNNLAVPEEEFLSERDVIIEERNQRTDTNPSAQFSERLNAAQFPNHPYGIPVIGWKHEIAALDYQTAMDFYARWYAPNNAIAVISGDVTLQQLKTLAEQTYGKLPSENVPARQMTQMPPLRGQGTFVMQDEKVRQPIWVRSFIAPSTSTDYNASLALQVFEQIMSGGASSRLYQSLVVEQKLASSAGLGYSSTALSHGDLSLQIVPLPNVRMDQIERAVEAELRKIITDGIPEKELLGAVDKMVDSSIYARDSIAGPAMIIGSALASDVPIERVEHWTQDLKTVTDDQIVKLVIDLFNPDNPELNPPITGHLLPKGYTEKAQDLKSQETQKQGDSK